MRAGTIRVPELLDEVLDLIEMRVADPGPLPSAVRDDARRALIDTVVCSQRLSARRVAERAGSALGVTGDGLAWHGTGRVPADFSFTRSLACAAEDLDSIHYRTFGHPASVAFPLLIHLRRLAQHGPLDAPRLPDPLLGYAVAVDAIARVADLTGPALRERGLHATVALAPAVAAGVGVALLGGRRTQTATAMSLAMRSALASQGAFGSNHKYLRVAFGTRDAVEAAMMSLAEGQGAGLMDWGTLLEVLAGTPDGAFAADTRWASEDLPTRIKLVAACGYFDSPSAGLRGILPSSVRAGAARVVSASVHAEVLRHARYDWPTTLDEARFSLKYLLVAMANGALVGADLPDPRASAWLRPQVDALQIAEADDEHWGELVVEIDGSVRRVRVARIPAVAVPPDRAIVAKLDAPSPQSIHDIQQLLADLGAEPLPQEALELVSATTR